MSYTFVEKGKSRKWNKHWRAENDKGKNWLKTTCKNVVPPPNGACMCLALKNEINNSITEYSTEKEVQEKQQANHSAVKYIYTSFQVVAAVTTWGISSVARFDLPVGQVHCYPDWDPPAFVDYAPRPKKGRVRRHEASRRRSSSTHATRLRPGHEGERTRRVNIIINNTASTEKTTCRRYLCSW